ncbi:ATG5 protein [Emericellopsis atlantica]|uniref:Autophagy protein 5 n=1 Tax=Emericellopsis atlantica TaxID=2614577 RepID=A0A9P7ZG16_9HYPO|nr:ATG5 protein [Emericellopsis atlantica]KAG9251449.1 ATG5 protein [Emericellopsis atlantica]
MTSPSLSAALWRSTVPVHITHPNHPNTPFITSLPRFSYLALLLPRLSTFFGVSISSFHYEDVQLRNLAVGVLVDLYDPVLPWRVTVGEGGGWDIGDTFLNSAKEADFVRNGNANQIMKMSKDDTTALWNAVVDNDHATFHRINARLLNTPSPLKHVPLRVYIPESDPQVREGAGSFRIVQRLVPAVGQDRRPQTLGVVLRNMMPELFPSVRDPVRVGAVMHGASVPFSAPVGELMREAAYPDGWLCLVIRV